MVSIDQLREEQKNATNRGEPDIFSDVCSESNCSSKGQADNAEGNRDTSIIRRTTFSIDSILGTVSQGEKAPGPPSPGTLMREVPSPSGNLAHPPCPTPPSTPSHSYQITNTEDCDKKISNVSNRNPNVVSQFTNHTHRDINAPNTLLLRVPSAVTSKNCSSSGSNLINPSINTNNENTFKKSDVTFLADTATSTSNTFPSFSFKHWQSFMPHLLQYDETKRQECEKLINNSISHDLMMKALRNNIQNYQNADGFLKQEDGQVRLEESHENTENEENRGYNTVEKREDDDEHELKTNNNNNIINNKIMVSQNLMQHNFQIKELIKEEIECGRDLSSDHSRSPIQTNKSSTNSSPDTNCYNNPL